MNINDYKKNAANKIGISTATFYPLELEKAFDMICRLDYKVCEIFVNTKSETELEFLKEIKRKADDNCVKIASVHPYFSGHESFLFFTDYPRRIHDSIDLYRQFLDAAVFLGAEYIIFHGLKSEVRNYPAEKYAENFLMLADEAKKYGIEVLQENVAVTYCSSPDFIRQLNEVTANINKKIRYTLDFKHALISGEDILELLDVMGENLAHVHFNDMDLTSSEILTRQSCKLPFLGDMNYEPIFQKLLDIKYIGNYILEVYRNNYETEADIIESKRRLNIFCEKNTGGG